MKIAGWVFRFSVVFRPWCLAFPATMAARWELWFLLSAYVAAVSFALPTSLVEEIKNSEIKNNKVKRAHSDHTGPEENIGRVSYFNKPTSAIKRGTNLKPQDTDLPEWNEGQLFRSGGGDFNMDNVQSGLFTSPNIALDDKTLAEYEKGYRYGTNKDKLDEALENAVLKGDFYGEPYSQYRYYGGDDRRRRRDTIKRPKRNIDLTPEEVLALLTLYENNHQEANNYRQPIVRYNKNYDPEDFDMDSNNDSWGNGPAFPHASIDEDVPDNYLLDYANSLQPEYRSRWGNFDDAKKKRFVAKKRTSDPTRMIRYINGPSENDFNTLSNLMNNQKESKLNVPVYHRLIL